MNDRSSNKSIKTCYLLSKYQALQKKALKEGGVLREKRSGEKTIPSISENISFSKSWTHFGQDHLSRALPGKTVSKLLQLNPYGMYRKTATSIKPCIAYYTRKEPPFIILILSLKCWKQCQINQSYCINHLYGWEISTFIDQIINSMSWGKKPHNGLSFIICLHIHLLATR